MDPDTAWQDATDETLSVETRKEAIDALVQWFDKGGFLPAQYSVKRWDRLYRWGLQAHG